MPGYVVSRIVDVLNASGKGLSGSRVLVLGVAYKKDVGDTRESPSLRILRLLAAKGARVRYNGPYVDEIELGGETLRAVDLADEELRSADCVVIATDHTCYDYKHIAETAGLIFDTRGVTRNLVNTGVVRL